MEQWSIFHVMHVLSLALRDRKDQLDPGVSAQSSSGRGGFGSGLSPPLKCQTLSSYHCESWGHPHISKYLSQKQVRGLEEVIRVWQKFSFSVPERQVPRKVALHSENTTTHTEFTAREAWDWTMKLPKNHLLTINSSGLYKPAGPQFSHLFMCEPCDSPCRAGIWLPWVPCIALGTSKDLDHRDL